MFCPKCGDMLNQGNCEKCGFKISQTPQRVNTPKQTSYLKNKETILKSLITVCIVLVIMGFCFLFGGFDKKNNFYKSENTYVGGDAYNLIINSNYFTGYMVLGSACFVCSSVLFCTVLKIYGENDDEQ